MRGGAKAKTEVVVVTGDVKMGASPDEALDGVRLVMLANDVSLRNLIPAELAKNFGFLHSKPATAFGPVAVTPDELGDATWYEPTTHGTEARVREHLARLRALAVFTSRRPPKSQMAQSPVQVTIWPRAPGVFAG